MYQWKDKNEKNRENKKGKNLVNVSEEKESIEVQKIYVTQLSKLDGDPIPGFNRSQYGFHCPELVA